MAESDNPSAVPEARPQERLDAAAFAARFEASARRFWIIAAGVVRDPNLADDVVQEAAMVAYERLEQYEPGTNFAAWMSRIIRFVGLNIMRRERRRSAHRMDAPVGDLAESHRVHEERHTVVRSDGSLDADQSHFDDRLLRALESISPVARACLLLRTVEGLTYAEISSLLHVPEGTAMSHVHRARQHLRNALDPRDEPAHIVHSGRERQS